MGGSSSCRPLPASRAMYLTLKAAARRACRRPPAKSELRRTSRPKKQTDAGHAHRRITRKLGVWEDEPASAPALRSTL